MYPCSKNTEDGEEEMTKRDSVLRFLIREIDSMFSMIVEMILPIMGPDDGPEMVAHSLSSDFPVMRTARQVA